MFDRLKRTRSHGKVELEVDQTMLYKAYDILGIKRPVFTTTQPRIFMPVPPFTPVEGYYTHENGFHEVHLAEEAVKHWFNPERETVWRRMSVMELNEVIWHELTHASDVEKWGWQNYNMRYNFENMIVGYAKNSFEQHAQENQKKYHELSIIKAKI